MELMAMKHALRTQRFVQLEEQIRKSVRNRAPMHNLAMTEQTGKLSSKLIVAGTGGIATELVFVFKPDPSEVHIKSAVWDHTIRVRIVGTASTGLEQRQGHSRSWSVLDSEISVENMLEAAFRATFQI